MSDDDEHDEQQKKRRLPPTSEHAAAIETQTEGYIAEVFKETKRRVLAGLQALKVLPRDQPQAIVPTAPEHRLTSPPTPQTSALEQQRERMTPEQRQRHEAYLHGIPQTREKDALAAARVIRLEEGHRQAPELRGIHTTVTNRETDREVRTRERGEPVETRARDASRTSSDPDQTARAQNQQQKDADRQEAIRQHGADAPQEKVQEIRATKTQEQLRREYVKQFEATPDQKADIAQQQTRGMSRGRSR